MVPVYYHQKPPDKSRFASGHTDCLKITYSFHLASVYGFGLNFRHEQLTLYSKALTNLYQETWVGIA